VLHVARWKYRTQKWRKKSPSGHHPTTLSGYIFATEAYIDNQKNLVKQQYLLHMSPQYGELRPTSGWDRFGSLGHPSYFQRLRLRSVTARQSSSARQANFAALNRGRHLCSAGRPSRWALAHISSFRSFPYFSCFWFLFVGWLAVSFWAQVNIFHCIVSYELNCSWFSWYYLSSDFCS